MKLKQLKQDEAILCKTLQEFNSVCELLTKEGFTYGSGDEYGTNNEFGVYGNNTCLLPVNKSYAGLEFLEERGSIYTVYEASLFLKTESKQEKIHRLKKELEDLEREPELVIGKWYKSVDPENKAIFCIQEIHKDKMYGFGFSKSGCYVLATKTNNKGYWKAESTEITPATDKEVEAALINEAKKRGFKEGTVFYTPKHKLKYTANSSEFNLTYNQLYIGGSKGVSFCIFKDGQWAEIIEDQLPEINDHKGRLTYDKKTLVYGCAELPMKWFKPSENRKITSLTLDSGVTINETQINQIREYYDKVRKRD